MQTFTGLLTPHSAQCKHLLVCQLHTAQRKHLLACQLHILHCALNGFLLSIWTFDVWILLCTCGRICRVLKSLVSKCPFLFYFYYFMFIVHMHVCPACLCMREAAEKVKKTQQESWPGSLKRSVWMIWSMQVILVLIRRSLATLLINSTIRWLWTKKLSIQTHLGLDCRSEFHWHKHN